MSAVFDTVKDRIRAVCATKYEHILKFSLDCLKKSGKRGVCAFLYSSVDHALCCTVFNCHYFTSVELDFISFPEAIIALKDYDPELEALVSIIIYEGKNAKRMVLRITEEEHIKALASPYWDCCMSMHLTTSSRRIYCDYCKKEIMKKVLYQCNRCKKQIYCNRECQLADWPKHRFHCSKFPITNST